MRDESFCTDRQAESQELRETSAADRLTEREKWLRMSAAKERKARDKVKRALERLTNLILDLYTRARAKTRS